MEFFKHKPVLPIDRQTFLAGTLKYSLLQICMVLLFLIFMHSAYKTHEMSVYVLIAMVLTIGLMNLFFFKQRNYQGRFKDLYPNYELKYYVLLVFALIPIVSIFFDLFLCIKAKSPNEIPFMLFYQRKRLLFIVIPIVAFQLSSPSIAYWTANPLTYFCARIYNNAKDVLSLKEQFKKEDIKESIVDHYLNNKKDNVDTVELVLLTAASTSNVIHKKEKVLSKEDVDKIENNVKYSIILIKENNKIIAMLAQSEFKFSDFSLIQWINPTGITEIILLTIVDMKILEKFKIGLVDVTIGLMQNLKNGMVRLPVDVQAKYQLDIEKLNQSNSFKQ